MERFLSQSRFLVMITVAICMVAAVLLYASGLLIVGSLVIDFVRDVPATTERAKSIAVVLLKTLDLLLIAVTFQTIGLGLYRLFVAPTKAPDRASPGGFHQLKASVLWLSVVVLVVLFVEQAVAVGPTIEILYLGGAIAMVVGATVWAAERMGSHEDG